MSSGHCELYVTIGNTKPNYREFRPFILILSILLILTKINDYKRILARFVSF